MLIDKAEIERVKATTDLVALVESRGVRLTRKGRQMVGLCPFVTGHDKIGVRGHEDSRT